MPKMEAGSPASRPMSSSRILAAGQPPWDTKDVRWGFRTRSIDNTRLVHVVV